MEQFRFAQPELPSYSVEEAVAAAIHGTTAAEPHRYRHITADVSLLVYDVGCSVLPLDVDGLLAEAERLDSLDLSDPIGLALALRRSPPIKGDPYRGLGFAFQSRVTGQQASGKTYQEAVAFATEPLRLSVARQKFRVTYLRECSSGYLQAVRSPGYLQGALLTQITINEARKLLKDNR